MRRLQKSSEGDAGSEGDDLAENRGSAHEHRTPECGVLQPLFPGGREEGLTGIFPALAEEWVGDLRAQGSAASAGFSEDDGVVRSGAGAWRPRL